MKYDVPNVEPDQMEEASMPYSPGEELLRTDTQERKRQERLMAIEGVEGVGVSQDAVGGRAIVVYVRDAEAAKRVPPEIDGLNVQVQITGPITAGLNTNLSR